MDGDPKLLFTPSYTSTKVITFFNFTVLNPLNIRISSLRQLIIISFVSVLTPLLFMLWQANQTLENMAKTAATEPAYAVNVTRNVYQLERLALDIERITRQYQVLRSDDARTLAFNYFEQYEFQLDKLCEHFDDESACGNNREAIAVLKRNFLLDEQQLSQALV